MADLDEDVKAIIVTMFQGIVDFSGPTPRILAPTYLSEERTIPPGKRFRQLADVLYIGDGPGDQAIVGVRVQDGAEAGLYPLGFAPAVLGLEDAPTPTE